MTMITTRNINVDLGKLSKKLVNKTTKDVDASIRVEQPKIKQKPVSLQTANLPDVGLLKDKKRRDDIMEQRKLYLKDEKMLKINEKRQGKEEKKPWKDMTEEERQVETKKQMIEPKIVEPSKKFAAELKAAKKKESLGEMTEPEKQAYMKDRINNIPEPSEEDTAWIKEAGKRYDMKEKLASQKKPWNKMNAKERKEYQAEKAKKVKK